MSSVSDIKLIRTDFFFYKNHRLYSGIKSTIYKEGYIKLLEKKNKKIISNNTEAWVSPGTQESPPGEAVKV